MTCFGAVPLFLGLLFLTYGLDEGCFSDYCSGDQQNLNAPMLVGIGMLMMTLLIWTITMAAAAICWQGRQIP